MRAAVMESGLLVFFYFGLVLGIGWAVIVLGAVVLSLFSIWRITFSGGLIGYLLMNYQPTTVIGIAAGLALTWKHRRMRRRIASR